MVLNLRESSSPVQSIPVVIYSCHFTVKDNVKVKVGLCFDTKQIYMYKNITTLECCYIFVHVDLFCIKT